MRQAEDNLSLRERINAGLTRYWKFATIILVAIITAMAGILIFDAVQENKHNDSAELAEDIQNLFNDWLEVEPEDRIDDEIIVLVNRALAEYPSHFAAQRALFTRGRMAYEREKWLEAATDFELLANRWDDSYLAPVCLFNAGSAKEQADDIEGAKDLWTKLINLYAEVSPHTPETLFNLGRIAEGENDVETAIEKYAEITSRFPDSRWSNISKSRIIFIENRSS